MNNVKVAIFLFFLVCLVWVTHCFVSEKIEDSGGNGSDTLTSRMETQLRKSIDTLKVAENDDFEDLDREFKNLRHGINKAYTAAAFHDDALTNDSIRLVLIHELSDSYATAFNRACNRFFDQAEWNASQLQFIEEQTDSLLGSSDIILSSITSDHIQKIKDAISTYQQIMEFLTANKNYSPNSTFSYEDISTEFDSLSLRATSFLTMQMGDIYLSNHSGLSDELFQVKILLYEKHIQYIKDLIDDPNSRNMSFLDELFGQEPSTDYISRIINNFSYTIYGVSQDKWEDDKGLLLRLLQRAQNPPSDPHPSGGPRQATMVKIKGDNVNIRQNPDIRSHVIFQLNRNDTCRFMHISRHEVVNGHFGFWYKIQHMNRQGWVFSQFAELY